MSKPDLYNNPFYFALPKRTSTTVSEAAAHIASQFGVVGTVEHVRTELAFALFRITSAPTRATSTASAGVGGREA